jgi:hypothetical protein
MHSIWVKPIRPKARDRRVSDVAISTEGKFSIALGLLTVGGGDALWVAPDHTEIGWGMVAVAVVGGIALAVYHFSEMLRRSWTPSAKIRMIALLGMII